MKMDTGMFGEQYACEYLKTKGYRILARNYHSRYGEIDVIASNDRYLVFAEVKTRSPGAIAQPQAAVTKSKQQKLIKTALLWMQKNPPEKQPRFDVIALTVGGEPLAVTELTHFENAFGTNGF